MNPRARAFTIALVLGLAAVLCPAGAPAALKGSLHDWADETGPQPNALAGNGSCSACHLSHGAGSRLLWARSLSEESAYFKQVASPNYVPGTTLLCLDCHDDSGMTTMPAVDGSPAKSIWVSGHEPQNIAFTDAVPGSPTTTASAVGYYELVDGRQPPGGSGGGPTDGSPTGGHYWKTEPSGTPDYRRGDKIPCSLCHDPHDVATGTNEAFFLTAAPDGGGGTVSLQNGLKASTFNATLNPKGSRTGTGTGREMCAACHGLSNGGTQVRLWGVTVPKPPGTISAHLSTSATPCTVCHPHNRVTARCTDCHGDKNTATYFYPDDGAKGGVAGKPNRKGRHDTHIPRIAAVMGGAYSAANSSTCDWCHPGGGHSGDEATPNPEPAELHPGGAGSHFKTINGLPDTGDSVTIGSSCNDVNCHYNTTVTIADWYAAAPTATCDYCHYGGAGTYTASDLPNAHTAHVDEIVDGGAHLACTQCHPGSGYAAGHQDGSVQVVFGTTTLGEPGATLASASADGTVKYGGAGAYAVCSNLYCHGADTLQGGTWQLAGGTKTAPGWNTPTDGDCGTCHDTGTQPGETSPATVLASGNHPAHLTAAYGPTFDPSTLATSCDQCHPAYTAVPYSTYHVNGTRDFANVAPTPAVSPLGTLAVSTPTASDTDRCTNCHATANVAAGVGTVLAKANWSDGAYKLDCLTCHNAAAPATSTAAGGAPAAPAKDTNWTTRGHGNTTTYPWAPNRGGAAAACATCHATTAAHLNGALGQDRLTTAGNGLCAGCHDGPGAGSAVTQVSTHANTSGTMGAAPVSYTAQRAQFELNCVECHDVHGTANISMVNTENPDGPLAAPRLYNGSANTTSLLFQGTAVAFTANTGGADYAETAANANKICQTCHTTTGGSGTPVYRHNSATTGHATSKCVGCHAHDVDDNYAANSQDGFMPRGDCKGCHDAASPYDPGGGKAAAPGINMAWWQASGHGKSASPVVDCTDCHDISLPGSPSTHLDGTYNSIWENGAVVTRNTNTAHLRPEYFSPVTSVGPGKWSTQVTFDNRCASQCHAGPPLQAKEMRHETDTPATASNHWSVQLGTHLTYKKGDRSGTPGDDATNAPYPIDCDLSTSGDCTGGGYAPCVSCHDPHGTAIFEPGNPGTNFMMRRNWLTWDAGPYLCKGCHP